MNNGAEGSTVSEDERPHAKDRILDAAYDIVTTSGEAALRFVDVAERAGVALSVITRHFGTRERLVAAVHVRRFAGLVAEDVAVVTNLVGSGSAVEVAQVIGRLTREVVAAERAPARLARVSSIGAIHGRPELTASIEAEATRLLDGLSETISALQAEGLITAGVDPRALATFVQAYSLGMVLTDLDRSPPARHEIAKVVEVAVAAFLA
jgi:AcrR family transcriptional regulator